MLGGHCRFSMRQDRSTASECAGVASWSQRMDIVEPLEADEAQVTSVLVE